MADTLSTQISRVDRIVELHGQIEAALKTTLTQAIEVGRLLAEQKAELAHGQWGNWVAENLPFTVRTASRYMAIYRHREEVLKSDSVSDLAGAYKMLTVPAKVVKDEDVDQKVSQDISDQDLHRLGEGLSAGSRSKLQQIAKAGNAKLLRAIERGHITINRGMQIAKAPEDEQNALIQHAVFHGRSAPKGVAKTLGADTYEGGASYYADLAISQLRRIDAKDRNALEAIKKVEEWISSFCSAILEGRR